MSVSKRLRKLQETLLHIRVGSGAVVLPKDIKRLHLRYAPKINGGHMGARRFWREELVRLKYHNPAVPMSVDTSAAQDEIPLLSIHYVGPHARQTSSAPTSSPVSTESTAEGHTPSVADSTERVETIDCKLKTNSQIMQELMRMTQAQPVEPSAQDKEEMAHLEELRVKSLADSKLSQEVRARKKRERELLEQARGDIAANAV